LYLTKMVLLSWTQEVVDLLYEMVLSALTKEVMFLPHADGSISLDQGGYDSTS
jgi:hypothetical protein